AGREDERVLGVRLLDRRLVLDREEPAAAARQRRPGGVQERRPRMVELWAGPLDPVLLDPRIADPVPVRAQVGELVPDVLRALVLGPARAERPGDGDHDPPVLARLAGAVE